MRRLAIALFAVLPAYPQDALEIVRKSLDRDIANFEHLKNYTYQQREEDREYDKAGALKKTESETTEVLILGGRPYEKRIARDDKPLSEKDARKEQEEMDKEVAKRSNLSESEKQKLEKRRLENRKFLREIPDAFSFRLVGTEPVSGKPTWVIDATPKPGFRAKDIRAKILSKMRGRIWVDQGEYQWVKVDAQVLDTISLGLALFRISPGGRILFEQTRVNDEVWLPAHAQFHIDGRLGYIKTLHSEVELNYSDYRKFQTDSRIVASEPK
ncbi:MAG: hypothetical protein LAO79_26490 [Acidobacteriia bacterium]|nr:hypothetical protein [Terriglobia bacterium]